MNHDQTEVLVEEVYMESELLAIKNTISFCLSKC